MPKPDPLWKEKVLEWQTSGKSSKVWCQENKIPYTTLCGWRKRLHNLKKDDLKENQLKPSFIELNELKESDPGIILEYDGFKIHLKAEFNADLLIRCLDCLRRLSC